MNEKEKMLAGKIYDPFGTELSTLRRESHELCLKYNQLKESDPQRNDILKELFGTDEINFYLQGPIQFDYGKFIKIGKNSYANFNLVILDCCPVTIGENVFMGPNVAILTPMHPLRYQDRNQYIREDGVLTDKEYAKPIVIKDNCWIAGNVTICGGVTIGEGCVIGAGSVVTRDIPSHSLAFGNPCRVIRKITDKDSLINYPELL